jgi:hypothetical protein
MGKRGLQKGVCSGSFPLLSAHDVLLSLSLILSETGRSGLTLPPLSGGVVGVEMVMPNGKHVLIEPETPNNPNHPGVNHPLSSPGVKVHWEAPNPVPIPLPASWKGLFDDTFQRVRRNDKWIFAVDGLKKCLANLSGCVNGSCRQSCCAVCVLCSSAICGGVCCGCQLQTRANLESVGQHDEQKIPHGCCKFGESCCQICDCCHCCTREYVPPFPQLQHKTRNKKKQANKQTNEQANNKRPKKTKKTKASLARLFFPHFHFFLSSSLD